MHIYDHGEKTFCRGNLYRICKSFINKVNQDIIFNNTCKIQRFHAYEQKPFFKELSKLIETLWIIVQASGYKSIPGSKMIMMHIFKCISKYTSKDACALHVGSFKWEDLYIEKELKRMAFLICDCICWNLAIMKINRKSYR